MEGLDGFKDGFKWMFKIELILERKMKMLPLLPIRSEDP